MKSKSIQYSIPEPCDKNWNDMQLETNGRFCGVCDHSVIDFSNMSDFSIVSYLENHKHEKVCGRFTKPQLDRVYHLNQPVFAPTFDLRAVVLGLALTTFSAVHSFSQTEIPKNPEQIDTTALIHPVIVGTIAYRRIDHSGEQFAKGTIKTELGQFSEVYAQLKNERGRVLQRVQPDSKGNFEFTLNWKKKPASIEFSGTGLETKELHFFEMKSLSNISVELEMEMMMIGQVIQLNPDQL
jgi:hypothetical protein